MLGRYEAAGLPDLGEHLIGDPVLEALRVGQPSAHDQPIQAAFTDYRRLTISAVCVAKSRRYALIRGQLRSMLSGTVYAASGR